MGPSINTPRNARAAASQRSGRGRDGQHQAEYDEQRASSEAVGLADLQATGRELQAMGYSKQAGRAVLGVEHQVCVTNAVTVTGAQKLGKES
jgi:hypothetical protein